MCSRSVGWWHPVENDDDRRWILLDDDVQQKTLAIGGDVVETQWNILQSTHARETAKPAFWYRRALLAQRRAEFLPNTQLEDATWYVRFRAIGFQPYVDSGFLSRSRSIHFSRNVLGSDRS